MIDLYETIGASPGDDTMTIRRKYRRTAARAHPDAGGSAEAFGRAVLARDVLTDPKRRRKYDETGQAEETAPNPVASRACNMVMGFVDVVMQTCEKRGLAIETVDVVKDALTTLDMHRSSERRKREQAVGIERRMRDLATRFSTKKGRPNRVRPMLEARANEARRGVESIDLELAALDVAEAMLRDHVYAWDESGAGVRSIRT